eukprot:09231_5
MLQYSSDQHSSKDRDWQVGPVRHPDPVDSSKPHTRRLSCSKSQPHKRAQQGADKPKKKRLEQRTHVSSFTSRTKERSKPLV